MAIGLGPVARRVDGGPRWRPRIAVAALVLTFATGVAVAKVSPGWLAIGTTYEVHDGGGIATLGRPSRGSAQEPGDTCVLSWMTEVTPVGRTPGQGTLVRVEDGFDQDTGTGDGDVLHCTTGSLVFVPTFAPERSWPTPAEARARDAAYVKAAADRKAEWGRATDSAVSCGAAGDCQDGPDTP